MPTTKLSTHFTLDEFTRSQAAIDMGDTNQPTEEHFNHLTKLAWQMEEVRALFGKPLIVTSGYRNPHVNAAVGGVPNSDHALGYAADFKIEGIDDLEAAKVVRDSNIKFDQLIYEAGRAVHLSFHPRMRQQVLRQPGGPNTPVYEGLEA